MERQLTQGSVFKNLVRFSIPFLLSNFLQTLYGMADLFIAGQYNGPNIITAVSIGSQIMHMFTVIIVGLSMGSTVLIGRSVGEGNSTKTNSLITTTSIVFAIAAIFFTIILLCCCNIIVSSVSTPKESVEQTKIYLYICFSGIPFIIAYNVISSILRGMGDSKSPMIFIAISCVINVIFDYLFMGVFDFHAGGAAFATILAQAISVIIAFLYIFIINHKKNNSKIDKSKNTKFNKSFAWEILKIGIPVACQDGFIQIAFLIITIIANKRGLNDAAAVGIVEKIICFLFLVPSAMLSAVSALSAQNFGAKQPLRAEKTLLYGILIGITSGFIFAISFQFISEFVIGLFVNDSAVITLGTQYMHSYVFDCMFAAIHFSFSGYFCACKRSLLAFIHNVISIVLIRIPGAILASTLFPQTLFPMGLAATTGSLLSSIICLIMFLSFYKKDRAAI